MISLQNVTKNFGKLTALSQISMELKAGHSYALLGPNGSGKTTLIKCVLGMALPTGGEIKINGKNIQGEHLYRKSIGYMPQIGYYPESLKIGQLFDMMRNLRKEIRETDEELIDAFGLNQIMDKRMRTLSGGTRQKVSAALAFLFKPNILILDEPTAGLDPIAVEFLKEKMLREKKAGKLFIITSHILSDLEEITTDMIYLFEGSIRYNSSIEDLKRETGQVRFAKAIATLIKQQDMEIKELMVS